MFYEILAVLVLQGGTDPGLECHGRKLVAVVPLVDHLVDHDQMVLGIDGDCTL